MPIVVRSGLYAFLYVDRRYNRAAGRIPILRGLEGILSLMCFCIRAARLLVLRATTDGEHLAKTSVGVFVCGRCNLGLFWPNRG